MNRMAESYVEKNEAFRNKIPRDRLDICLSSGRRKSDDELILKLRTFGLSVDRQTLSEWQTGFLSAEALAKWIIEKKTSALKDLRSTGCGYALPSFGSDGFLNLRVLRCSTI